MQNVKEVYLYRGFVITIATDLKAPLVESYHLEEAQLNAMQ